MIDFSAARRMMVDGQVRTSDVTDLRIIAAMLEVPREAFAPADFIDEGHFSPAGAIKFANRIAPAIRDACR